MIGLLWKDLFNLKGQIKIYIIFPFFFMGIGYMQNSLAYMPMMIMMVGVFLPISAFAYDDMANFDSYALTLPLDRKAIISSKYLLSILCIATISIVATLLSFALIAIVGMGALQVESYLEVALQVYAMSMVALTMGNFLIPLEYKFGSEKARIALIVMFAMIGAIGYLLLSMIHSSVFGITQLIEVFEANAILIMSALGMGSLLLSYTISYRIVKKKQY